MGVGEMVWAGWTRGRDQWSTLVNRAINECSGSWKCWIFISCCTNGSLSRRAPLRGDGRLRHSKFCLVTISFLVRKMSYVQLGSLLKIMTPYDGHLRPKHVVEELLNNFKWFVTNHVVRKTVFTSKKLNAWRATGCWNTAFVTDVSENCAEYDTILTHCLSRDTTRMHCWGTHDALELLVAVLPEGIPWRCWRLP
jgi:hypothetical protein